jgi:hypothetical protein
VEEKSGYLIDFATSKNLVVFSIYDAARAACKGGPPLPDQYSRATIQK